MAAWLLGMRDVGQLATHPKRGSLFEYLMVNEFDKHALNRGFTSELHFYRDEIQED